MIEDAKKFAIDLQVDVDQCAQVCMFQNSQCNPTHLRTSACFLDVVVSVGIALTLFLDMN